MKIRGYGYGLSDKNVEQNVCLVPDENKIWKDPRRNKHLYSTLSSLDIHTSYIHRPASIYSYDVRPFNCTLHLLNMNFSHFFAIDSNQL